MESVSLSSVFLHHVRTQWGGGHLQTRTWALTRNQGGLHLDLGLADPRTVRNKSWCLSHSVYGILLKQPTLTKTCALSHPPFPPATPRSCVWELSLRGMPFLPMWWIEKCCGITLLGINDKWGLCINTLIAGCDNSVESILHWLSKWAHGIELQMPIMGAG